jgi:hypothetical protein
VTRCQGLIRNAQPLDTNGQVTWRVTSSTTVEDWSSAGSRVKRWTSMAAIGLFRLEKVRP